MSSGYVLLTVLFLTAAFVVSLLVYHYYTRASLRSIPWLCSVCHVVALYMCVMSFPLLVVDVDAALDAHATGHAAQTWLKPIWMTIFAVTYISAWVTLPLAQMYTEVGDFTPRRALLHSLKLNAKLYAVIIAVIVLVFVYILIAKGAYTSLASVLKIGISLANSWGLLMLILFMPAGLVGVPRMLWRNANAQQRLRRLLYDAIDIHEDLDLAAMDLASVKAELIHTDPLVGDEHRVYLTQMLELISRADRDVPLYHLAAQRVKTTPPTSRHDVTLAHLEELNARLKHSLKIVYRTSYRWTSTVRHCAALDELLQRQQGLPVPTPSLSQQQQQTTSYTSTTSAATTAAAAGDGVTSMSAGVTRIAQAALQRVWRSTRTYAYWTACALCTTLTCLILWSELVLPFRSLTTSPLGVIELVMNSRVHFAGSVVLLFYMAYCSYWAAFQFKVFDVYVVYPRIADNASLCFNEVFLVRLLMPLCFNFLLISGLSDAATGVDVMYGYVYRRNMDISLLFGTWANRFLPLLIPFLSAIVLANLAQRALAVIGVDVHSPNDINKPVVRQRIEDGRRLVEHALGRALVVTTLSPDDGVGGATDASSSSATAATDVTVVAAAPPARGQRYREYVEARKRAGGGGSADV